MPQRPHSSPVKTRISGRRWLCSGSRNPIRWIRPAGPAGFEAWADDEKKRQNVTDKAAVVGLDPKQAASVQAAAGKIAGYIPTMRAAAAKADPSISSLNTALTLAKKASSLMKSHDQIDT
jgi:hypothetical protein